MEEPNIKNTGENTLAKKLEVGPNAPIKMTDTITTVTLPSKMAEKAAFIP